MEMYKLEGVLDQQLSRISYPLQGIKDYLGTHTEHMECMATRLDYIASYVEGVKDKLGVLEDIARNLEDIKDIRDSLGELVDVQRNQTMALENIATALIAIADNLTR